MASIKITEGGAMLPDFLNQVSKEIF